MTQVKKSPSSNKAYLCQITDSVGEILIILYLCELRGKIEKIEILSMVF